MKKCKAQKDSTCILKLAQSQLFYFSHNICCDWSCERFTSWGMCYILYKVLILFTKYCSIFTSTNLLDTVVMTKGHWCFCIYEVLFCNNYWWTDIGFSINQYWYLECRVASGRYPSNVTNKRAVVLNMILSADWLYSSIMDLFHWLLSHFHSEHHKSSFFRYLKKI